MVVRLSEIDPKGEYTPNQVAKMLGCTVQKIYKKIEQKILIARNDNYGGERPTYIIEGYDLRTYILNTRRKTSNNREE